MPILFDKSSRIFSLTTKNSLYQMKADPSGLLLHLYYGKRTDQDMSYLIRCADRGFCGNFYEYRDQREHSPDQLPQEYSGYGTGDYRLSSIMATLNNGSRSIDLRYLGYRLLHDTPIPQILPHVRSGQEAEYLEIVLRDPVACLSVRLIYGVFDQLDIITRSVSIANEGKEPFTLNKAASACLDFPHADLDAVHFAGRPCMERITERIDLPEGITAFGSRRGASSHHSNPFVILCSKDATESAGNCFGVMLMYSAGHLEEIEKDQTGSVRVVTGIQPDGFSWQLKRGDYFQTPQAILSFSEHGFNGLSANYHSLIRNHVIPREFRNLRSPVLINSWEACYFDFNDEKLLSLAREAAGLGVELFVLDDGWFGHRNDDNTSLGDWTVNQKKLKSGLTDLSTKIHALGMQFGLWFEPEMISEDSDLFRAHPEWVLRDPGRRPVLSRNQLVLDMSREDVVDYLFDAITSILEQAQIEYIKWDFNRALANVYSNALPADRQGEVPHRFMLGTYRLLARLRERYPHLLIEGCAGGGGRFDAGMLFFSPQIWCSDDTDPIERLQIQRGTSYGYPSHTMGSHVSASPNHQTGRHTPFETRGVVALSGAFGYELDLNQITEEEKNCIKEQIAAYKKYASLTMTGKYYRLTEIDAAADYEAWMLASEDCGEALLSLVMTHVRANALFPHVQLCGLNPRGCYEIEETGERMTGAALMYGGYAFNQLRGDYPAVQLHFIRKDTVQNNIAEEKSCEY